MTEKDFQTALKQLINKGQILASCPQCCIPLSSNEFKSKKCKTCGSIDTEKVTFQVTNEVKN